MERWQSMKVDIENGKIIFEENGKEYSFNAHGEAPHPSLMPMISVGGKHLSSRSDNVKIEKHTSIQDIAVGHGMVAWYTQEFLPDGEDFKLSKNANIYIGYFSSGEEKHIYNGECYGDLCFYEDDLFFNLGNKVAVYHITSGEMEVLFKHSGIKKSGLDLHVTPKRVFFQHWTHSTNNTMWYDRETKELVNPHFDGTPMFFLNDELIIYHGIEHTWLYDVDKMKKKRFFSNKKCNGIIEQVAVFFGIPKEHIANYHSGWPKIRLEKLEGGRLFFECFFSYHVDGLNYKEQCRKVYNLGLPAILITRISCDFFAEDIKIEACKEDIVREETPYNLKDIEFPYVTLRTFRN